MLPQKPRRKNSVSPRSLQVSPRNSQTSSEANFPFPPINSQKNLVDWNLLMSKRQEGFEAGTSDISYMSGTNETQHPIKSVDQFFSPKSGTMLSDIPSPKSRAISLKPRTRKFKPSGLISYKSQPDIHDVLYVQATMQPPQTVEELVTYLDKINSRYMEVVGKHDQGSIAHQIWEVALSTVKEVAEFDRLIKETDLSRQRSFNKFLSKNQSTQTTSFMDELASHEHALIDWETDKAWHEMEEQYEKIKEKLAKDKKLQGSQAASNLKQMYREQCDAQIEVEDVLVDDDYEYPDMDWPMEMYHKMSKMYMVAKKRVRKSMTKVTHEAGIQTEEAIMTQEQHREIKEEATKWKLQFRIAKKETATVEEKLTRVRTKCATLEETQRQPMERKNDEYRERYMQLQQKSFYLENSYNELKLRYDKLEQEHEKCEPIKDKLVKRLGDSQRILQENIESNRQNKERADEFEAKYTQVAKVMLSIDKRDEEKAAAEFEKEMKLNQRRNFMLRAKQKRELEVQNAAKEKKWDSISQPRCHSSSSESLDSFIQRAMSRMTIEHEDNKSNLGRDQMDSVDLDFMDAIKDPSKRRGSSFSNRRRGSLSSRPRLGKKKNDIQSKKKQDFSKTMSLSSEKKSQKPKEQKSSIILKLPKPPSIKRQKSSINLSSKSSSSRSRKNLSIKLGNNKTKISGSSLLVNSIDDKIPEANIADEVSPMPEIYLLQPAKSGSLMSLGETEESEPLNQTTTESEPSIYSQARSPPVDEPPKQGMFTGAQVPEPGPERSKYRRNSTLQLYSASEKEQVKELQQVAPPVVETRPATTYHAEIEVVEVEARPSTTEKSIQTPRKRHQNLQTIEEQPTIDERTSPSPEKQQTIKPPKVTLTPTNKSLFYEQLPHPPKEKKKPMPKPVEEVKLLFSPKSAKEFEIPMETNLVNIIKASLPSTAISSTPRNAISLQPTPRHLKRKFELPEIVLPQRQFKSIVPNKSVGIDTDELKILNALKNSVGVQINFEPGDGPNASSIVDRSMTTSEMRKYMFKTNPNSLLGLRGDVFSNAGSFTSTPIMPTSHRRSNSVSVTDPMTSPYTNNATDSSHSSHITLVTVEEKPKRRKNSKRSLFK